MGYINSVFDKGGSIWGEHISTVAENSIIRQHMISLGIESSCDETAAAIVQIDNNRVKILSNVLASSASMHVKYGGVLPEQAARHQLESILPVIQEALDQAGLTFEKIDTIAIAPGPGLIGSLLVGVETAKTLALVYNKPLVPITHLIGHFYANWIETDSPPPFPCIGLLVSGGHSDLVLFKDHNEYEYLGGTRDDAAGECFDKCARMLGLPYPGGPNLSRLAAEGNPTAFKLPRPMWDSKDFDFSFSGLKTAVSNLIKEQTLDEQTIKDLCASIEQAIVDSLVHKTLLAAKQHTIKDIMIAGGVAANQRLRDTLTERFDGKVYIPEPKYCTDNAAMIATAACYNNHPVDPLTLQANPNLSLAY